MKLRLKVYFILVHFILFHFFSFYFIVSKKFIDDSMDLASGKKTEADIELSIFSIFVVFYIFS